MDTLAVSVPEPDIVEACTTSSLKLPVTVVVATTPSVVNLTTNCVVRVTVRPTIVPVIELAQPSQFAVVP